MDSILSTLGFKNLTTTQSEQLGELAAETILNNALGYLDDRLTEGEMYDIQQLLGLEEQRVLFDYLSSRGIDFVAVLDEEYAQYERQQSTARAILTGGVV